MGAAIFLHMFFSPKKEITNIKRRVWLVNVNSLFSSAKRELLLQLTHGW